MSASEIQNSVFVHWLSIGILMVKISFILWAVAIFVSSKTDVRSVWNLFWMIILDCLGNVGCTILCCIVRSIIAKDHVGFSDWLRVPAADPFAFLGIIHLVVCGGKVSKRITQANMWLLLVDRFGSIVAIFFHEIIFVVGTIVGSIVTKNKVFVSMHFL